MPLLSVQRYVKGILDDLSIPGQSGLLRAQITPPGVQKLDRPTAFVWGGSMRATRQAGPRGNPGQAGFKHLQWEVDVWLKYLANPNSQTVDEEFPAFVDAVMAQVWSTVMPTFIDSQGVPVPSATTYYDGLTQILNIGEDFRLEYAPVHAVSNQRTLTFDARLTLDVYEAVQA